MDLLLVACRTPDGEVAHYSLTHPLYKANLDSPVGDLVRVIDAIKQIPARHHAEVWVHTVGGGAVQVADTIAKVAGRDLTKPPFIKFMDDAGREFLGPIPTRTPEQGQTQRLESLARDAGARALQAFSAAGGAGVGSSVRRRKRTRRTAQRSTRRSSRRPSRN